MCVDVKICGMTHRDDVVQALDAGADYVGFVLYDKSPRGLSPTALRRILDAVNRPCRAVAVFVNASRDVVDRVAADCGLYAVQIHGDESPGEFAGLDRRLWRAVRVGAGAAAVSLDSWAAERYVVDASVPGAYGGTGALADWALAAALAVEYPVMLAGGLTPDNVARAVAEVRPLGVDVSSGVERAPGRKDHAKVARFIASVKRHE